MIDNPIPIPLQISWYIKFFCYKCKTFNRDYRDDTKKLINKFIFFWHTFSKISIYDIIIFWIRAPRRTIHLISNKFSLYIHYLAITITFLFYNLLSTHFEIPFLNLFFINDVIIMIISNIAIPIFSLDTIPYPCPDLATLFIKSYVYDLQ